MKEVQSFLSQKNFSHFFFKLTTIQSLFALLGCYFVLFQARTFDEPKGDYCYLKAICLNLTSPLIPAIAASLLALGLILPSIFFKFGRSYYIALNLLMVLPGVIVVPVLVFVVQSRVLRNILIMSLWAFFVNQLGLFVFSVFTLLLKKQFCYKMAIFLLFGSYLKSLFALYFIFKESFLNIGIMFGFQLLMGVYYILDLSQIVH